jgi:Rad3-related DNA helicase
MHYSTQVRKKKAGGGGAGWLAKGSAGALVKTITLHFWCLNPAVCFDELKNSCRSIVLTSGMTSVFCVGFRYKNIK